MHGLEPDEEVLEAQQSLVERGVIEPLGKSAAEARQWLAWELASLIECCSIATLM